METELWTHPAHPSMAIDRMVGSVRRRSATSLLFHYVAHGRIGELILPARANPQRADNLWRTTCFEAFLRPAGRGDYIELNFSPSGQWAAYHFTAYRAGMVQFPLPGPPEIELRTDADMLELQAIVSLDLPDDPYTLALTAVIEEGRFSKSYWAAGHSAKPDFHHPDCFVDRLPPAPVS